MAVASAAAASSWRGAWAKVQRAGTGTDFGILGGVVHHEWAVTQYVGIRLGFGFTTRD